MGPRISHQALQRAREVYQLAHVVLRLVALAEFVLLLQRVVQRDAELERDQLRDAVGKPVAHPQHARDVAHHCLRGHGAVGDDLRDAVAAIAVGNVLDDPVAALHAEVHVEVRHGHPLGIEEPLEQQVVPQRVEVGDPEHPGHQRARAGAATRTDRHAILAGPADEVRDDQEVTGEAHLADDAQFGREPRLVVGTIDRGAIVGGLRHGGCREPRLEPLARLFAQELLRGLPGGHRVRRQRSLAEPHLEVEAPGDFHRVLDRLGNVGEQLRHLLGRTQVLLLAVAPRARRVRQQRAIVYADARLVRLEIVAGEEPHVVRCDHRHALRHRERQAPGDVLLFARAPGPLQFQVEAVTEQCQPRGERRARICLVSCEQCPADVAVAAAGQGHETRRAVGAEPGPVQRRTMPALAFEVGTRDQSRQVAIAAIVLAEQHQAARLGTLSFLLHQRVDSHQRLQAAGLGRRVELHQREQVALVRDRHRGHAQPRAGIDQALAQQLAVLVLALDAHDPVHQ